VTATLERIYRWAANLPATDSIPIYDTEAFDLANYAVANNSYHIGELRDAALAAAIFEDILAGRFQIAGHTVVVL
jgi:hypothetical protein